MHDFEVHVYYNIQPLIEKWPMNNGCPWDCVRNAFHVEHRYDRGTLPRLDEEFISTVGINVPSMLSEADEEKIIAVLDYVYANVITGSRSG
jgi:hypothetical protein